MQNKHGMQGSRSDTTVCTETHVQKTGREQKGEGSVKSKRKRKEALETVIYTLPAIVLVTIMMYIPFVMRRLLFPDKMERYRKGRRIHRTGKLQDDFSGEQRV